MPRNKKTSTIVVRPITRGAQTPKKVVLATLAELNDHAPMVCPPTFAPLLRTRPLPPCHCPWPCGPALPTAAPAKTIAAYADAQASVLQEEITAHLRKYEETKPWKQESRSHRQYGWGWARRNPGPDDGKTWVSRQFVCGTAVEPRLSADAHDEDVEHEWQAEWDGPSETEHPRDRARMEVSIMDIAKPAKLRGTFKPRL
ncbi:hypothetical protein OH76DRAFT_1400253 [Lentinus brumalis]|uniref:Uncharacterized protein n=1 Tax=Lentinus brumalis TaxID=2498619 RepID=A0A371DIV8_9APHY|nr:hypothetical protein OH76DRAFT_1400253 [Polyporus brumalis]